MRCCAGSRSLRARRRSSSRGDVDPAQPDQRPGRRGAEPQAASGRRRGAATRSSWAPARRDWAPRSTPRPRASTTVLDRLRRAGRPGEHLVAHRELPRLPRRDLRLRARGARDACRPRASACASSLRRASTRSAQRGRLPRRRARRRPAPSTARTVVLATGASYRRLACRAWRSSKAPASTTPPRQVEAQICGGRRGGCRRRRQLRGPGRGLPFQHADHVDLLIRAGRPRGDHVALPRRPGGHDRIDRAASLHRRSASCTATAISRAITVEHTRDGDDASYETARGVRVHRRGPLHGVARRGAGHRRRRLHPDRPGPQVTHLDPAGDGASARRFLWRPACPASSRSGDVRIGLDQARRVGGRRGRDGRPADPPVPRAADGQRGPTRVATRGSPGASTSGGGDACGDGTHPRPPGPAGDRADHDRVPDDRRNQDSLRRHQPVLRAVDPAHKPMARGRARLRADLRRCSAPRARLFALDLPDLVSPDAMGEFLVRLVEECALGRPHIVAPDVGTSGALSAVAARPDLFLSVIVGSGAAPSRSSCCLRSRPRS